MAAGPIRNSNIDGEGLTILTQAAEWYDEHDPVHGLDHVLRVAALAEKLARASTADLEIVLAAALLHDAKGAAPVGGTADRADHERASATFAAGILTEEGWPPDRIEAVQHCIRAHRYRGSESPRTLEAKVLFDADKLDVLGAFGIARTIAYACQAGQPIFQPPSGQFIETGELAPGEAHSAYHEYVFKLQRVKDRLQTEVGRQWAEAREPLLHAFFRQLAAEASGEI
ncbi:MAG: HD domain-containing protein [Anaerolineales bacterium]